MYFYSLLVFSHRNSKLKLELHLVSFLRMLSSSKSSHNDNLEERRQKILLWTVHHMIRRFCINPVFGKLSCITKLVGRKENLREAQTLKHMKKKTYKK